VRTAAVDAFLSELKTKRSADLNAVLVTLNDGSLCRQALWHWISNGWVVVAPHSPLVAMAGPALGPELTLRAFCGEPGQAPPLQPGPRQAGGATSASQEANEEEGATE